MEVVDTVGAQLIPVINKLQEVCSLLKEPLIDLPQIVVIGGQSSGKSSVLENLVGRDFLPRGSGLVTRVPLVLQLYREQGEEEWGEFSHAPGRRFSFPQIRSEIEAQTERLTGKNKAISHTPIILKVYSPNVLPLTLVDTPGMTRVPVGDQPADIEQRIRKLINEYINQPNSIILAVQAANQDLATSDALNLARAADPHGERTVGVLTKLDIMDRGTSAVSTLMGDNIALKLGFIGIVNRSQEDINKGKAVKDALETERQFFRTHHEYSSIQNLGNLGTLALANKCSKLLGQHIQRVLPTLRNQVRKAIKEKQELLHSLGTPVVQEKSAQGWLLLHLLNKYGDHFRSAIDGIPDELTTNQLNGGARIRHVFHDTFSKHMERIDPLEGLSAQDIKTAIRNAAGPRPSLFVPERAFELLVKKQLELLREPSLRCAEMIADELYRLVNQLDLPEIQRFKELKVRVADVAHTTIRKTLKPCNKMIEDILACEGAYLNTNHADFIGTQLLSSSVKEQVASETIEEIPVRNVAPVEQKKSGFFGRLFGGSQDDESPKMKINPAARPGTAGYKPAVDPFQDSDSLSERDKTQIKLLRQLVRSYFKISQRSLQDQVIKATMHFLVNQVKEKLQSDLVGALYKEELFELLLAEDPSMANKRRLTADQVDTLKQAKKIIQSAELSDLSPSGVDFK